MTPPKKTADAPGASVSRLANKPPVQLRDSNRSAGLSQGMRDRSGEVSVHRVVSPPVEGRVERSEEVSESFGGFDFRATT